MITYLEEKLGFPKEASDFFDDTLARITLISGARDDLERARRFYFDGDAAPCEEILEAISKESGVHRYTVDMIFLLLSLEPLHKLYQEKGYSDELFIDTMRDLTYKLYECWHVHGIWGTFVFFWYHKFFTLELFALGRLQFHRRPLPLESYGGIWKQGDNVFACHIPSSGPLKYDDVMDSLKKAHVFFADELRDGVLAIHCRSWLLYPPHANLFPKGSNLERFYNLFDVVESEEDPKNKDFFRVFGMPYSKEALMAIEPDTTLRKNLKEFLLNGNCMGTSHGMILFDGERVDCLIYTGAIDELFEYK